MDVIKNLEGVHIPELGEIRFSSLPIYAAINVNQPDLHVNFDPHTKNWTVLWKWPDGHPPEYLKNQVSEYPMSRQASDECEGGLQTWLENGWVIPNSEGELDPP